MLPSAAVAVCWVVYLPRGDVWQTPPPPRGQNDRCLWKYYLAATMLRTVITSKHNFIDILFVVKSTIFVWHRGHHVNLNTTCGLFCTGTNWSRLLRLSLMLFVRNKFPWGNCWLINLHPLFCIVFPRDIISICMGSTLGFFLRIQYLFWEGGILS